MKKLLKKAAALAAVGLFIGLGGTIAYAETEDNNTNLTANVIQSGVAMSGTISAKEDVDWYKFEVTERGYFTVNLKINENEPVADFGQGLKFTLYNQNGIKQIKVYDKITDYNGKTTMKIPAELGEYFVKVEMTNTYYTCLNKMYDLTVTMTADESWELEDNNSDQKNELQSGVPVTGTLYLPEDVDWYKFQVTERGYFTVGLKVNESVAAGDYGHGFKFTVYDQNGSNVIKTYDNITDYNGKSTMKIPAGKGEYLVKVEMTNDYYTCTDVMYDLTVTTTADDTWELEKNNTNQDALEINNGSLYKGTLSYAEDEDWYKFTVKKSGYTTVTLTRDESMASNVGIGKGFHFDVYEAGDITNPVKSGTEITTYNGYTTPRMPLAPGEYYIRVKMTNTYYTCTDVIYNVEVTETEDLTFEQEKNNVVAHANALTNQKEKFGMLSYSNDEDYYSFKITKKGYFQVQFTNSLENHVDDIRYGWNVSVYEKNDVVNTLVSYNSINSFLTEELAFKPGDYIIKVRSVNDYYAPVDCGYSVKVIETAANGWEAEGNDSILKANTLSTSGSVKGYLWHANDKDYYKVTLTTDGTLTVDVKNLNQEENGRGWKVNVYQNGKADKSLYEIKNITSSGSGKIGLKKGTYYIKLEADSTYNISKSQYVLSTSFAKTVSKPATFKIGSVAGGTKAIQVKWSQQSNIAGYELQYATSKTFKSAKTRSVSKTATSVKISGLKSKTNYYVRIRAYKLVNGKKLYGGYSNIRVVKTK